MRICDRRRACRAVLVVALALASAVAPSLTAHAADGPGTAPLPTSVAPPTSVRPSSPSTTARTSATSAPRSSASSATPVTSSPSTSHHYRSTSAYRAPSTRAATSYSISESETGGPTQSFVLGSASLGSLGDSTSSVTPSPSSSSSGGDETGRYVHLFFTVVVLAAVLLAGGIAGLVLTRDGRYTGGRHR